MTAAAPQNRGGNMGTEFTEVEYRSHIPAVMGSNPIGSCQRLTDSLAGIQKTVLAVLWQQNSQGILRLLPGSHIWSSSRIGRAAAVTGS